MSFESKTYDLGHMHKMRLEISQELRRQDKLRSSMREKNFKTRATRTNNIGLNSNLLCARIVGEQFSGTELCQGSRAIHAKPTSTT